MAIPNCNNLRGFPESKLLYESLTEAINRFEKCTNSEKINSVPSTQTFVDCHKVGIEIKQQLAQVNDIPGLLDVLCEPQTVNVDDLNVKDFEEDAVILSTLSTSIGRFVQSFTPPQPSLIKFKCSLCDRQFEKLWVVKRHMKEHTKLLEKYILPV